MTKEYDLVVLGGGTGGYVAALRASQLGMKVALVEHKKVGGTCLHQGCIPSKALLRTAEMYRQTKNMLEYGIEVAQFKLNFPAAQARKDKIVDTLHTGVESLLKKAKVAIYNGFGRILGPSIFSPIPGTISVEHGAGLDNTMLIPKNVLIATGSRPKSLSDIEIDGIHILDSTHALQLKTLPKSMLIVGGGVIGIEWASMLCDLGVQITVVENNENILNGEDEDVRYEIKKALQHRGVTFLTNATIDQNSIKINQSEVTLTIKNNETKNRLVVEKVLISVGREANIDQIGLMNTSIEVKNGVIVTNDMYQTKESHIYAIGDCIGGLQLAHVASAEGIVAVEHMAGKKTTTLNPLEIPSCIYSYPEAAKIGLTEKKALEQGYQIKVGKFPFQGIGKAHVFGERNGFVKIISDQKTEDILGVHMVGPQATDMISEAALAKILDATSWEFSQVVRPHPTLSEVFSEAALAVERLQIHG